MKVGTEKPERERERSCFICGVFLQGTGHDRSLFPYWKRGGGPGPCADGRCLRTDLSHTRERKVDSFVEMGKGKKGTTISHALPKKKKESKSGKRGRRR